MAEKKNIITKKTGNYCELFNEAMCLWDNHHEENFVDRYYKAQDAKIKAGLPIRDRPSVAIIDGYRKGRFLSIKDREQARIFLLAKTDNEVENVIARVKRYLKSDSRRKLLAYAQDFEYEVRRAEEYSKGQRAAGINPAACSGAAKRPFRHMYSDS